MVANKWDTQVSQANMQSMYASFRNVKIKNGKNRFSFWTCRVIRELEDGMISSVAKGIKLC